jgi:NADPH2:quinone reductase
MANYMYTPEEGRFYTEEVFGMISDGTLKIAIFKEYEFTAEDLQQAHKDLAGGKTVGKLVVKVADE